MYRVGISLSKVGMNIPSMTLFFYNRCIKIAIINWRFKSYYLNKASYEYCLIENHIEEVGIFFGITK